MKRFMIATLAAIPILIAAAILLRSASPPAVEPAQTRPFTTTVDTSEVIEMQEGHDEPAMPDQAVVALDDAITLEEPGDDAISWLKTSDDLTERQAAGADDVQESGASREPVDSQLEPGEQLTLDQTATTDTSLRNTDFPRTYISSIRVDLTSPNHWVRLVWSGPNAASQETGPFHSSPGRGLGDNDCDDVDESNRDGSNCTPKGTMQVQGFSDSMPMYSHCRHVTWFQIARGIAFHYYPQVPNYPASHGCVRLDAHAAQLIHNNSKIGATEVVVDGKWRFVR
jgi:hypothetical protein